MIKRERYLVERVKRLAGLTAEPALHVAAQEFAPVLREYIFETLSNVTA